MIQFILNEKEISTDLPQGTLLLDFIRYHRHLTGTKIGCREGDCGACTVLIGECKGEQLQYRSATSCLTAIANVAGKHIVTVEGINFPNKLNPIQQAMCSHSATQCGFCTPGFVVSLAGFCLTDAAPTSSNAIAAIDGNICRCTGYKSIELAAHDVASLLATRNETDPILFATTQNILPSYFTGIKEKLQLLLQKTMVPVSITPNLNPTKFLGGGTDLYVQQHDTMTQETITSLFNVPHLNGVEAYNNQIHIGAAATVTDLMESRDLTQLFPSFLQFTKLISSTPIRNIATVAGNLINASPIGDLTIIFLALDAQLVLTKGGITRTLPLRKLYQGYKKIDKEVDEYIQSIWFQIPDTNTKFHFEKVSKRTHLDIASVNTAISIQTDGNRIIEASLSAGGVGPIPTILSKTSEILVGKPLDMRTIDEAIAVAQTEITPISDARGTEAYKRLLLQQLIKAHFITLFPEAMIT